ncbi:hypothetical protein BASA81_004952 [Batrachochytrium salamandrivorans]|nr:hypothetical protein BASA81_004952 [Batrachochytrium salamandrivorans]
MYFVAESAQAAAAVAVGKKPRPPQQQSGLMFLVLLYLALLYRSTTKAMLFFKDHFAKSSMIKQVAEAHQILLKYLSDKALVVVRIGIVFLTFCLNKLLNGRPGMVAVEFMRNHGVSFQDSLQARLEEWLDKQLDFLGDKTKDTIKDPYMPLFVQRVCDDLVDSLLPDSKRLILTKTDELIRSKSIVTRDLAEGAILADPKGIGPAQSRLKLPDQLVSNTATSATTTTTLSSLLDPVGVVLHLAWDVAAQPYRVYQSPATYRPMLSYQYWTAAATAAATASTTDPTTNPTGDNKDSILDDLEEQDEEEQSQVGLFTRAYALVRQLPSKTKAKILYTSSPCDKSSWQCFQDYRWWLLTGIGLAPYGLGTVWWLMLFTLHNKRDEYQVSNFIVGFMTSKFLGGVGLLLYGTWQYYLCATVHHHSCEDRGPRVQQHMDAVLFFIQISLVWLCFFLLPMTEPCRVVLDVRDRHLVIDMDRVHNRVPNRIRGGRLGQMFWWESTCVLVVVAMGLMALYLFQVHQHTGRLLTELYWLKVIFGLLSLPFLVFKIPILSTLLMQVRATGYDPNGRVVLHTKSRLPVTSTNNQLLPTTTTASRDITLARLSDEEDDEEEDGDSEGDEH